MSIFARWKLAYQKHFDGFNQTFGTSLRPLFEPMTGFDVIQFDDIVQPEGDESTLDCVRRKYGEDAVTMILELIDGIDI